LQIRIRIIFGCWVRIRIRVKSWIKISVADPEPEPDPEESETFGRIRSGTEINVSDQDSQWRPGHIKSWK